MFEKGFDLVEGMLDYLDECRETLLESDLDDQLVSKLIGLLDEYSDRVRHMVDDEN